MGFQEFGKPREQENDHQMALGDSMASERAREYGSIGFTSQKHELGKFHIIDYESRSKRKEISNTQQLANFSEPQNADIARHNTPSRSVGSRKKVSPFRKYDDTPAPRTYKDGDTLRPDQVTVLPLAAHERHKMMEYSPGAVFADRQHGGELLGATPQAPRVLDLMQEEGAVVTGRTRAALDAYPDDRDGEDGPSPESAEGRRGAQYSSDEEGEEFGTGKARGGVCQIACLALSVSFRSRVQVCLIGQNQGSSKSYSFRADEDSSFIGCEPKKLQIFLCSDQDKLPVITTESPKLLIRVMAADEDLKSPSKLDPLELGRLEIDPSMVWALFEELNDETIVLPILGRSQTINSNITESVAGLGLEVIGTLILGCKALGNFQSLDGRPLQVDDEPIARPKAYGGKHEPGLFDAVKDRDEFSIFVRNGMTGFEYQSKDTNNPYDSQGMANRMEFYSAADSAPKDKRVSKQGLGTAGLQITSFDFKKSALNSWITMKLKSDEKLRTLMTEISNYELGGSIIQRGQRCELYYQQSCKNRATGPHPSVKSLTNTRSTRSANSNKSHSVILNSIRTLKEESHNLESFNINLSANFLLNWTALERTDSYQQRLGRLLQLRIPQSTIRYKSLETKIRRVRIMNYLYHHLLSSYYPSPPSPYPSFPPAPPQPLAPAGLQEDYHVLHLFVARHCSTVADLLSAQPAFLLLLVPLLLEVFAGVLAGEVWARVLDGLFVHAVGLGSGGGVGGEGRDRDVQGSWLAMFLCVALYRFDQALQHGKVRHQATQPLKMTFKTFLSEDASSLMEFLRSELASFQTKSAESQKNFFTHLYFSIHEAVSAAGPVDNALRSREEVKDNTDHQLSVQKTDKMLKVAANLLQLGQQSNLPVSRLEAIVSKYEAPSEKKIFIRMTSFRKRNTYSTYSTNKTEQDTTKFDQSWEETVLSRYKIMLYLPDSLSEEATAANDSNGLMVSTNFGMGGSVIPTFKKHELRMGGSVNQTGNDPEAQSARETGTSRIAELTFTPSSGLGVSMLPQKLNQPVNPSDVNVCLELWENDPFDMYRTVRDTLVDSTRLNLRHLPMHAPHSVEVKFASRQNLQEEYVVAFQVLVTDRQLLEQLDTNMSGPRQTSPDLASWTTTPVKGHIHSSLADGGAANNTGGSAATFLCSEGGDHFIKTGRDKVVSVNAIENAISAKLDFLFKCLFTVGQHPHMKSSTSPKTQYFRLTRDHRDPSVDYMDLVKNIGTVPDMPASKVASSLGALDQPASSFGLYLSTLILNKDLSLLATSLQRYFDREGNGITARDLVVSFQKLVSLLSITPHHLEAADYLQTLLGPIVSLRPRLVRCVCFFVDTSVYDLETLLLKATSSQDTSQSIKMMDITNCIQDLLHWFSLKYDCPVLPLGDSTSLFVLQSIMQQTLGFRLPEAFTNNFLTVEMEIDGQCIKKSVSFDQDYRPKVAKVPSQDLEDSLFDRYVREAAQEVPIEPRSVSYVSPNYHSVHRVVNSKLPVVEAWMNFDLLKIDVRASTATTVSRIQVDQLLHCTEFMTYFLDVVKP